MQHITSLHVLLDSKTLRGPYRKCIATAGIECTLASTEFDEIQLNKTIDAYQGKILTNKPA
jgi:hypothetical protein